MRRFPTTAYSFLATFPNLFAAFMVFFCINAAHANNDKEALRMSFAKGQVFSVIIPVTHKTPQGKAARKEYYDAAFPLASQYGLKREGQIRINSSSSKQFKPKTMAFFSWPDQASENQLIARAEWPSIKSLRPIAWEVLNIYSKELDKKLELSFHSNKHYTLAMAWIKESHPEDYQQYLSNIEPAVKQAGGRFIYTMRSPQYEAHGIHTQAPKGSRHAAPSQLTFVEWDTEDGLKAFQASELFKQNAHRIKSGTDQFHLFRMHL